MEETQSPKRHPWVSILTPVLNGWEFLEEAAASVFYQITEDGQTSTGEPELSFDWEWLIGVNGHGPTGGPALEMAHRIGQLFESSGITHHGKVRVMNFPNCKGKVSTLNAMVEYARADWIAILDADDTWSREKLLLQRLASEKDAAGAACIGTFCTYFGEVQSGGPVLPAGWIRPEDFRAGNPIINSSAIVRRDEARWRDDYWGVEDFDLWCRLATEKKGLYNIPLRVTHHRIHRASSFNTSEKQSAALVQLASYWNPRLFSAR
jgi:glycosyltransferase involved in cell wall biosynthesis